MARQKLSGPKKKKSTTGAKKSRPRKRMGASGKIESVAMDLLSVGGGIVGMNEVAILAGGMFPSLMATPIYTAFGEIILGGLIAWKGKSGWLRLVGLGGAGNGVYTLLKGTGAIGAGPQTMSYDFRNRRMLGDPRIQFVAGPTTRIGSNVGSYPNNFNLVAGPGRRAKNRYAS